MKELAGRFAVLTGGGTGMGRELARQLAKEGCHVAMCDVSAPNMAETKRLCLEGAPKGTLISTFVADVADEKQLQAWAEAVKRDLNTDHIHLLFNNAGTGAAISFVNGSRADWERVFAINWGGVYFGTRTFLPLMMKAKEGHIVNTSSVNALWAFIGSRVPHTSYCASKFAVRGFSEALQIDLRANAPHIKCSVVMPGHIGTDILANRATILGSDGDISGLRKMMAASGADVSDKTDGEVAAMFAAFFRDAAPMTAAEAATIILDGVKADKWRIVVGKDAEIMDRMVRETPERAYSEDFIAEVLKATGLIMR